MDRLYSNAKMRFQSFFMLTTIGPLEPVKDTDIRPLVQSPARPPTAMPVILPCASKPNKRLVASPREKAVLDRIRLGLVAEVPLSRKIG